MTNPSGGSGNDEGPQLTKEASPAPVPGEQQLPSFDQDDDGPDVSLPPPRIPAGPNRGMISTPPPPLASRADEAAPDSAADAGTRPRRISTSPLAGIPVTPPPGIVLSTGLRRSTPPAREPSVPPPSGSPADAPPSSAPASGARSLERPSTQAARNAWSQPPPRVISSEESSRPATGLDTSPLPKIAALLRDPVEELRAEQMQRRSASRRRRTLLAIGIVVSLAVLVTIAVVGLTLLRSVLWTDTPDAPASASAETQAAPVPEPPVSTPAVASAVESASAAVAVSSLPLASSSPAPTATQSAQPAKAAGSTTKTAVKPSGNPAPVATAGASGTIPDFGGRE